MARINIVKVIEMKNKETELVADALARVLAGGMLDEETLYALADIESEEGRAALVDGAAKITAKFSPRKFDFCSIINARSGRCPENCKWCAQSVHFSTGCDEYGMVDTEESLRASDLNADAGVMRFSLVASGRKVTGRDLDRVCDDIKAINARGRIKTCASLGLLDEAALRKLWDAGVRRYHCNLETAPSYFPTLCTTHTQADKLETINAARRIGFEVCSGGIIGMGESRRQRMELAIELRKVHPASIPINILCPIPGTPLENVPLISEEEIIDCVAMFRFAHPRVQLRFAGGRKRMSRENTIRAMRTGINGAIVGDLLTTIGATMDEDRITVTEAGYEP